MFGFVVGFVLDSFWNRFGLIWISLDCFGICLDSFVLVLELFGICLDSFGFRFGIVFEIVCSFWICVEH